MTFVLDPVEPSDLHLIGATFVRQVEGGKEVSPDDLDLTVLSDPVTMGSLRSNAKGADLVSRLDAGIFPILFEVLLDQENRLRSLQALPAVTRAQYRSALIALWKSL